MVGTIPMTAFDILPQAIVANTADADSKATSRDCQDTFYTARVFTMKVGQSVAMLPFIGIPTVSMASGVGYRIVAMCATMLCSLDDTVFTFYNEKKALGVLETRRCYQVPPQYPYEAVWVTRPICDTGASPCRHACDTSASNCI